MNKDELQKLLQERLSNVEVKTRFRNVIVARNGAYVMASPFGDEVQIKAHTPLVWFLPGILLAAVASTTIRTKMLWTFILYFIGTMIGGMLYAVLKKRDIELLKNEMEVALGTDFK